MDGKTKMKEICKTPEAAAILEEYVPGLTTNDQLKMAYGMGLKHVISMPQIGLTKEQVDEIITKIEAL